MYQLKKYCNTTSICWMGRLFFEAPLDEYLKQKKIIIWPTKPLLIFLPPTSICFAHTWGKLVWSRQLQLRWHLVQVPKWSIIHSPQRLRKMKKTPFDCWQIRPNWTLTSHSNHSQEIMTLSPWIPSSVFPVYYIPRPGTLTWMNIRLFFILSFDHARFNENEYLICQPKESRMWLNQI